MNESIEDEIIDFKNNKTTIPINLKKVMYFESNKRKIVIHEVNGIVETYEKMNTVIALLPSRFIEIHKSYVVNLDFMKSIENQRATLYNEQYLPISKRCYKEVREKFYKYNGGIQI